MTALLEVHGLDCLVGRIPLLTGVHFTLAPGEVLALIGRDGAGKSTLFKHLTGELPVRAGEVRLLGTPLARHGAEALALRRAVVPQSTHLPFSYEVLEVVLMGRIPHLRRQRGESDENARIARECLQRVGLGGSETRDYQTLSGGEQQRVHIARALAQLHGTPGPRLLLMDEPTSSLDVAHQHQTLRLVKALSGEGVAALLILQDLNLVAQYADRVLALAERRTLAFGTPAEVLTPELLERTFGHPMTTRPHPWLPCPLIVPGARPPDADR
jgi:iron complex transport system ATP-binding protein